MKDRIMDEGVERGEPLEVRTPPPSDTPILRRATPDPSVPSAVAAPFPPAWHLPPRPRGGDRQRERLEPAASALRVPSTGATPSELAYTNQLFDLYIRRRER